MEHVMRAVSGAVGIGLLGGLTYNRRLVRVAIFMSRGHWSPWPVYLKRMSTDLMWGNQVLVQGECSVIVIALSSRQLPGITIRRECN
jgi:hypothetical protein